jgi:hypothetical protein
VSARKAALAIIAHEIPQEVGDYIVLLNAGFSRGRALFFNAFSGFAAVIGGVIGYFVVGPWQGMLPYLLVIASSSFIYVSVADLIPQLQHRLTLKETAAQLLWALRGSRHRRARDLATAPALTAFGTRIGCRRDPSAPERARARPGIRPRFVRSIAQARLLQRMTSTGIFVCFSTSCVSLPRNREARPLRPCEPMTSRSQPAVSARSTIASQGCKPSIVTA